MKAVKENTFTDIEEVLELIEAEVRKAEFVPRVSADKLAYTYRINQENRNITFELSIGNFEDDLVILVYGETICIDSGFTYKIGIPHYTFFGRTSKEFLTDFREAVQLVED